MLPDLDELPELGAVPTRVDGVLTAVTEQSLMVMHPDTGRYHVLSTSAALVYTSIDGVATLEEITRDLAELMGTDATSLDVDVRASVASMIHEQIVAIDRTPVAEPPADPHARAERWAEIRLRALDSRAWPQRLGPFLAGLTPVEVLLTDVDVASRVKPLLDLLPAAPPQAATTPIHVARFAGRDRVYLRGMAVDRPSANTQLTAEIVLSACNQAAALGPDGTIRLHAAAVERDGHGVIVCGASGHGKSSLATALLAAGWRYLTDEVAIVHPGDLTMTAYPKWVDLSSEAIERVGHSPSQPLAGTGYEEHLPPSDLGEISRGARLAGVVILNRYPSLGDAPLVEALSPTDALVTMLGNVFESTWRDSSSLQSLADVCAKVPVVTLHRAPFGSMVEAVANLVETGKEREQAGAR